MSWSGGKGGKGPLRVAPVEAKEFPLSGFFPILSHLGSVVMVLGPGECCSVICRDILCWALGMLGSPPFFQL